MPRSLRPWGVILPLALLGVLGGHDLAYRLTGTPRDGLHSYVQHGPQVALILTVLSLFGAALVERGARIALWPFPVVVLTAFVLQEHIERLAHGGSMPFLLDKPYFVLGLVLQTIVAIVAWQVARLLIRAVGKRVVRELRMSLRRVVFAPVRSQARAAATPGGIRSRAPPR